MALKKCFKLHKLFLSELERCARLDREGAQVLSSLANVGKRVPVLESAPSAALGVLAFIPDTPALLLEKHFSAMEKSATFLRDIMRDFVDTVRRLRTFTDEFVDLVDEVSLVTADDGDSDRAESALEAALGMLEWMENVRTMYERDALRKRLLVSDVEYSDVVRLQRMHREWPASAGVSFVDVDYVRRGTEELPPLPVVPLDEGDEGPSSAASTKKKKKSTK